MIIYLVGNLVEKIGNSLIILPNSGVGLEVEVINANLYDINTELKLYIFSHTKEDGTHLYGFDDIASRDVFKTLLSVSGVGAKLAMKLLRELGVERLVASINLEDDAVLSSVSGVGKKTSSRLLIELKGKLDNYTQAGQSANVWQAYDAMIGLGFSKVEIEKRLEKIKDKASLSVEELLKLALQK